MNLKHIPALFWKTPASPPSMSRQWRTRPPAALIEGPGPSKALSSATPRFLGPDGFQGVPAADLTGWTRRSGTPGPVLGSRHTLVDKRASKGFEGLNFSAWANISEVYRGGQGKLLLGVPHGTSSRYLSDTNFRHLQGHQGTLSAGERQVPKSRWLGGRDSNPDTQIQSLQSYR